jgi:hypothetical protein
MFKVFVLTKFAIRKTHTPHIDESLTFDNPRVPLPQRCWKGDLMFKLRFLAVATFCLLLPASAYADPVVIKNELDDNETAFTWTVIFRGLPARGDGFVINAQYINRPIEWGGSTNDVRNMSILVTDSDSDGIVDFLVLGRHLDGPHNAVGNMDIDPGSTFSIFIQNINALGDENKSLGFSVVQHLHFPGEHSDFVEVFGRRVGDDFTFIVAGIHRDTPVPEPISLFLLSTGLAGLAIKTRKRLKAPRTNKDTDRSV